jgi:glycosyltransferase involved in cell wall biosynthesis
MRPYVINARFVAKRTTGVQRSAHEIVSRLLSDDHGRYTLVSPKFDSASDPSLPIEQRGYIRYGHLWEQIELPRIVRSMGSDAVLYCPETSGPLAVVRQVMTMHDLFPVENPEWFSRAFSAWYRWLLPRLVKRVAYILANSEYTRQRLLERFSLPEDKVVLCPFAQGERFAPTSEEEVERFRVEQGLPKRYLLSIGNIAPRKNLATLATAWKQTMARREGVELIIAGGVNKAVFNTAGSGADALRDPTIRLLGFFPDEKLPLLYQGAEAYAFPSLAEGFGLPILEAMACGTPVICSDTTAMPETAGGAARLVPPREAEAWVEAIDSVLSEDHIRRRMRSDGLKRAAHFSWSCTAGIVRTTLEAV